MSDSLRKSLDQQLESLVRDIPPPRNLWPAIARGLRGRSRRARPMAFAAAAAVAGACLASALTWAVLHGRQAAPALQLAAAHAATFDEPRNPRYVAARDSLELNFRERLKLLDPATRTKIEASLAVIRQAMRTKTSVRRWRTIRRVPCSNSSGKAPGTMNSTCMNMWYRPPNLR